MSGDNGATQAGQGIPAKQLTAEEKAKAKADKFAKSPEMFVDMDDLICGAVKNEVGQVGTIIGQATRGQYLMAQADLNYRLHNVLDYIEAEKQKAQRIVTPQQAQPKHGILNFVRGRN